MTAKLEQALRLGRRVASGQTRKGSAIPYVEHVRRGDDPRPARVRRGRRDRGAAARRGRGHRGDAGQVEARFGAEVAETGRHCSEIKLDAQGRKRPWIDRKRDHLAALGQAPVAARAVMLADKLHNLSSIVVDLDAGGRSGRSSTPSARRCSGIIAR